MKTLYAFSSPDGDVPVDDATFARPFIVRPLQDHPFITLGDYFLAVRDLVLRKEGQPLTALLSHLWKRSVEITDIDAITVRYEKYGTLYHISSVEIAAERKQIRLTVSAALTDESKEALDREFDLLERLGSEKSLSYLPHVYCKHTLQVRKSEGSVIFLMALSEWFDNYHEWHFSRDETGRQRIMVWDMKNGYRMLSEEEAYETIKQAATILTFYYDTKTYHRIFPWHHGGGDFVVRATEGNTDAHGFARGNLFSEHGEREGEAPTALPVEGATRAPVIDVKLVTARGYEPITLPAEDGEIAPLRAVILFFLETTVKMRLDKYEGMGESTWAKASVVAAAVDGFLRGLTLKESRTDTPAFKVNDVLAQLKSFTQDDLKGLLRTRMNQAAGRDTSDYAAISSHIDEHARDLHQAIQEQATTD